MKYKYDEATEANIKGFKALLLQINEIVMSRLNEMDISHQEARKLFLNDPERVKILEELSEVYRNAIPISVEIENDTNWTGNIASCKVCRA